jgi:alpha-galactosidase
MPIKITMIGAGSIGFTRRLMRDILTVPELADAHFGFTDISGQNLDMVTQLCQRDITLNKLPAKITSTTDRRSALADADYAICTIRQGGLDAFQTDVDIPLKYGVDQCVGDTLCAGGLMYAQRTIPALLDFCKDIREVAKPNALLLNYSNPMAMNTWACNKYGGVKIIGLCHGVQGAHWQITSCIEHWAKKEGLIPADYGKPDADHKDYASGHKFQMHRDEVDVIFAGINHQTWCIKAQWRGMDMIPRLLEMFQQHPVFPTTEKVRIDVLKRFGYYSTESNGHLSEYVPWYRKRTGEIPKWIDLSSWINGETGGYLRVCTEGRNWFETDFPNWMKETPAPISPTDRSEEHGSWIIESLETGRTYRGHFNVVNQNHITNLPNGCIVEIPGYVDRSGISMPVIGDLPLACAATCGASVRVQEMGMEAAAAGNAMLLKQAMLHDPLTGAVCDPEEIWQMTDEMLVAQAPWLPQYIHEIPQAAKRLSDHERNGTRVKLKQTPGAARLHTKTVQEMAQDKTAARANAGTADKAGMTQAQ